MDVVARGGSRVLSPKGDLTILEAAEFREALLVQHEKGGRASLIWHRSTEWIRRQFGSSWRLFPLEGWKLCERSINGTSFYNGGFAPYQLLSR